MIKSVDRFLDIDGQLEQWPSKREDQKNVLRYLYAKLNIPNNGINEAELNAQLKGLHTFHDWPLLRRELCDGGFLVRDKYGYCYKKASYEK